MVCVCVCVCVCVWGAGRKQGQGSLGTSSSLQTQADVCVCVCVCVCLGGWQETSPGQPGNLLQPANTSRLHRLQPANSWPMGTRPFCSLLSSPCGCPPPRALTPSPLTSPACSWGLALGLGRKGGQGSSGRLGSYTHCP